MRNLINLVGRLGRKPVLREYPVASDETGETETRECVELSIVTNSLSEPVFHTAVGYSAHQVKLLGALDKGDKVMVTGYMFYGQSEKNGVKRVHPKAVIDSFEIMTPPRNKATAGETGTRHPMSAIAAAE